MSWFGIVVTVDASYNAAKQLYDYIETNQVVDWGQEKQQTFVTDTA